MKTELSVLPIYWEEVTKYPNPISGWKQLNHTPEPELHGISPFGHIYTVKVQAFTKRFVVSLHYKYPTVDHNRFYKEYGQDFETAIEAKEACHKFYRTILNEQIVW